MACNVEISPSGEVETPRTEERKVTDDGNPYYEIQSPCPDRGTVYLREYPASPTGNGPLYPYSEHRDSKGNQLTPEDYNQLVLSSMDSYTVDTRWFYLNMLSDLSLDQSFPSELSDDFGSYWFLTGKGLNFPPKFFLLVRG